MSGIFACGTGASGGRSDSGSIHLRAASTSSRDPRTAPPSPPHTILVAEKDMTARRPNPPTARPISRPPMHVVASSITVIGRSATSSAAAATAGSPNWWTMIAALHRPASDRRIPGGKERSLGSASTSQGRPPERTTARSIELQANAGIATSSPATSTTRSATSSAADPDDTAIAAGRLNIVMSANSSSLVASPPAPTQERSIVARTAARSCSPSCGRECGTSCLRRLSGCDTRVNRHLGKDIPGCRESRIGQQVEDRRISQAPSRHRCLPGLYRDVHAFPPEAVQWQVRQSRRARDVRGASDLLDQVENQISLCGMHIEVRTADNVDRRGEKLQNGLERPPADLVNRVRLMLVDRLDRLLGRAPIGAL